MSKDSLPKGAALSEEMSKELAALCQGIIADNEVNESEAKYLLQWLERNHKLSKHPFTAILFKQLCLFLQDGHLSRRESQALLDLIAAAPNFETLDSLIHSLPAHPELDSPAPAVAIQHHTFCLTGAFLAGTQGECEEWTRAHGGRISHARNGDYDYLVIGTLGSQYWHKAYKQVGVKIEKTLEKRLTEQANPKIISELHWLKALADAEKKRHTSGMPKEIALFLDYKVAS